MNAYELLCDRLDDCAAIGGACDVCSYSDEGCDLSTLLSAAAEVIEGYLYPESSGAFDCEEVIENCTVEIWRNSVTGEQSVGWYRGTKEDVTRIESQGSES